MALLQHPLSSAVRAAVEIRSQHPQQESHRPNISGHKSRFSILKDDGQNPLALANEFTRKGKPAEAWEIAERYLAEVDPNNLSALTVALDVWRKQNKPAVAYQFAARVAELAPEDPVAWSNLGMIADSLYRFDEAERCFQKAISYAGSEKEKGGTFTNWACMLINKGDWTVAEKMARRALKYKPDSVKTQANLGLACLAQGKWREGWKLYDAVIGFDQSRRKVQYKDEHVWDGSPDKRIVIYGEQGLGDEIMFASMIPDAIARSRSVVIDCTDRLQGLFRRSFPQATVYGTRWENGLGWDREHTEIDASISIGGLGQLFRNAPEDFPRTPYLVADPDRVEMWRGLFSKQGKPVIGIAWTGGVPWTADRFRRLSLEQLLPLFRSNDAVYISLQYKDASKEIAAFRNAHPEVDLRQYPWGTLTQDYDDTVAMVAALDAVVSLPTSVVHVAAGLGKRCIAMKAPMCCWRFHSGLMLDYPGMTLVDHDKDWDGTIAKAAAVLHGI
jgi:tetratricopeptide (TPR) repeat protein